MEAATAQGRQLYFTVNNYTDDEVASLRKTLSDSGLVRYATFGYEVGAEGTPHLQGYVSFKKQMRFNAVKKALFPPPCREHHVNRTKGSEEQNVAYCHKGNQCIDWKKNKTNDPNYGLDAQYEEFGKRQKINQRCDLDAFKEDVQNGVLDDDTLMELHSAVWAKYPTFVRQYVRKYLPKRKFKDFELRPWQKELEEMLKEEADDRSVVFVIDPVGNSGKTWFSSRYFTMNSNDTFYLSPTKKNDMTNLLPSKLRVLFIDCTRQRMRDADTMGYLYSFMEEVKNGFVTSGKYEGAVKIFSDPIHIVMLMNEEPDFQAMSADRYKKCLYLQKANSLWVDKEHHAMSLRDGGYFEPPKKKMRPGELYMTSDLSS